MKLTASIFWFIFTLVFLGLGITHWREMNNIIPAFMAPNFELERAAITLRSAGGGVVGLDEPVRLFVKDFNVYLKTQNLANAAANRRAALGYFAAAFTALVSMALVWQEDICALFRRNKSVATG